MLSEAMDYSQTSDLALIERFNEGYEQALVTLLRRREKWLWNVAKKTVVNDSLAEEGLQEALVLIWKNASSFRGESQVTSWMYQIVTRACIDVLRKEQLRAHSSTDELESVGQEFGGSIAFEDSLLENLVIHSALMELDPTQREIIIQLDMHGASVKEVSENLGIPIGTVKSRASRGRESLRDIISKINLENGNHSSDSNVSYLGVKKDVK